jgi:hypothetical protein
MVTNETTIRHQEPANQDKFLPGFFTGRLRARARDVNSPQFEPLGGSKTDT